jgi:hypothetical protein
MEAQGSTQKILFLIKVLKTGVVGRKISDSYRTTKRDRKGILLFLFQNFIARKPVQSSHGPTRLQRR